MKVSCKSCHVSHVWEWLGALSGRREGSVAEERRQITHTWLPDDPFLLPGFCSALLPSLPPPPPLPLFSYALCFHLPYTSPSVPLLLKTLTAFSSHVHFIFLLIFRLWFHYTCILLWQINSDTHQMSHFWQCLVLTRQAQLEECLAQRISSPCQSCRDQRCHLKSERNTNCLWCLCHYRSEGKTLFVCPYLMISFSTFGNWYSIWITFLEIIRTIIIFQPLQFKF